MYRPLQLIADIFLQAAIDEDLLFPEEFRHFTPGQLRPCSSYRIDPPGSNIQHDLLQMRRKLRNRTGGNAAAHCGMSDLRQVIAEEFRNALHAENPGLFSLG